MKIGILTYHRTHNYGGCLQAFATKVILEKMGHEVYYVDYWPEYHAEEYKLFSKQNYKKYNWKGKLRYLLNFILYFFYRKKRFDSFEAFHNKYTYPYCKPLTEKYDILIYGSDQIWRKQKALNNYNPVYFGINDFKANKHVAFSASMGVLPKNQNDIEVVNKYISHLDLLAVRENDLKKFLFNIGYIDTVHTIDPTLILTQEEWNKLMPTTRLVQERYILIYSLWGEVFDMVSIRKYAKEKGLKIVCLRGDANQWGSRYIFSSDGPVTFISLIKYADIVFSSSFHGLAFSLIFEKQFYVSFAKNSERAKSLLSSVGLINRYIDNNVPIPTREQFIDYRVISSNIRAIANQSLAYLTQVTSKKK